MGEFKSSKFKWIGLIALKTGVFGLGLSLGVQNSQDIKAAWYNITHGYQPAAQYFHQDGHRIKIENSTNDRGELQTFIKYNGKKVEVYEDLLPSNQTIYSTISERVKEANPEELDSLNAKTEGLQLIIDKMRGLEITDERKTLREYRILGEKNPELFDQMGAEFKTYALDNLYTKLMNEMYGGDLNGE